MNHIAKYKLTYFGMAVGAIGGYAYYHFVGCANDTCAITSKPLNSSLYGAMMGGVLFNLFKTEIKNKSMIDLIKNFFGIEKTNYAQLVKEGAVILDVRSKEEYASGHIKGSVNIPVNQLADNLHKFKDKTKPIITCCASGMRSASAKSILKSNEFTEVHNGGGWKSLQNEI